MKDFQIALAAVTGVILFIFGLEHFSKELQRITGEKFRVFLGRATRYPLIGVLLGALVTGIIQSSSATSVIAMGLVNAGILSFKNSIGIIFGSNVGTTVTAQLVAFKLTAFAPFFIIFGFILSFIRSKYSVFGKSLFYFGFVFFSLNLISSSLEPLGKNPEVMAFLAKPYGVFFGIFAGFLVTALIQSSSVTTGLAVVLTQQGLLTTENAIPVLMGANLGTTVTALLAIVNMDVSAKKTAAAHFFFNLGGVLLFLPIVLVFRKQLGSLSQDPALALANFHLLFNLATTLFFLVFINPFASILEKAMGEGEMDFERLNTNFYKKELDLPEALQKLQENLPSFFSFLGESFSLAALSFESNYKNALEALKKRNDYFGFIQKETQNFFSKLAVKAQDETSAAGLMRRMEPYEYLFQIQDTLESLAQVRQSLNENYVSIKPDLAALAREVSGETISFFNYLAKEDVTSKNRDEVKTKARDLQKEINRFRKEILKLMGKENREDAAYMLHFLGQLQRLKDKLATFHKVAAGLD